MMKPSQSIRQSQSLQQRLSPQQIQYIQLLQLPTLQLEQRIKQEIEENPVLEVDDDSSDEILESDAGMDNEDFKETSEDVIGDGNGAEGAVEYPEGGSDADELPAAVDQNKEIDWESFFSDDDTEYFPPRWNESDDWKELPRPQRTGFLDKMEQQIELLDLEESQKKIAYQIIGSVDTDGYLRRDLDSIIDAVAFNEGVFVTGGEAEDVLFQIQRLDPPGVAARNLRECLLIQLETMESSQPGKKLADRILKEAWPAFKNKHYDKIRQQLGISEKELKEAYSVIMLLDPKPGESDEYLNPDQFIVPDFEVYHEETLDGAETGNGEFVIEMHFRNMPKIRISKHYKELWDSISGGSRPQINPDSSLMESGGSRGSSDPVDSGTAGTDKGRDWKKKNKKDGHEESQTGRRKGKETGRNRSEDSETRQFIKDKVDSARWFIESIQQRKNTLMFVMRTIVALQEDFFRTGKGIRPMILKDVAERIQMDISTVSRAVNGKYVQTPFGVYELKYFFNEGLETDSGESVSNREIKNILSELVSNEDKLNPLSDQKLASMLAGKGYPVARRTVSKYREQLQIPVARMRKSIG